MATKSKNICHLTSVHARYDTRIFLKMCVSLAAHDYGVTLVVADGLGDETRSGVNICDVGAKSGGRISRMTDTTRRVFEKALALEAALYHIHDPELIPVGLKLKRLGFKVIFDSHEDVVADILDKPYLSPWLRKLISFGYGHFERYSCAQFDAIITATPWIREKFLSINPHAYGVNNFPLIGELLADATGEWRARGNRVCYVGGVADIRGIREIVQAMERCHSDARLSIAGKFANPQLESEMRAAQGWQRVDALGFLGRTEVADLLAGCKAGLVTFLPIANHVTAQPNKMFEYMSAGIPVIASDFPLWREIVEGNDCGLCVNPLEPDEIAVAIDYLMDNPERAREMGENGRQAVLQRYNWNVEESKLLMVYAQVLGEK